MPQPRDRIGDQADRQEDATRAVGVGGAEQTEGVERGVDDRACVLVELAEHLQPDARDLGRKELREHARECGAVRCGPEWNLVDGAGSVDANDRVCRA